MSDLPGTTAPTLERGPAWAAVVAAVTALLDGDDERARSHLDAGAEAEGWAAVSRRLAVAGRGLLADFVIGDPDRTGPADGARHDGAPVDDPVPGHAIPNGDAPRVPVRSPDEVIDIRHETVLDPSVSGTGDADSAWASLVAVSLLIAQGGFPAEVVI